MNTPNERLRKARETADFKTATDAAKRFHWKEPTYLGHENGSRGFPTKKAKLYAKAFKISLEWLVSGVGLMRAGATVQLVGYVGAGGLVMPVDDHTKGSGMAEVEAPPDMGPDTVALQVKGGSQWPAFDDGDLIYYDKHHASPEEALGRLSIVMLTTGELMFKMVTRGSMRGRFTLVSVNAPPLDDALLEWAAPITWIKKRR